MKFPLLAAFALTLASCATAPFSTTKHIWPRTSTSPATTLTSIDLSTTQINPTTTKISTSIIQRGHPRIQRVSLPVQAQYQNIQLTWINGSRFFITENGSSLIDYQKQANNVWYAKPIQSISNP